MTLRHPRVYQCRIPDKRDGGREPPLQLVALIVACLAQRVRERVLRLKDLLTIAASCTSVPLVVSDREVHNTASIRPSIELGSIAIELLMQRVVFARFAYHAGVC